MGPSSNWYFTAPYHRLSHFLSPPIPACAPFSNPVAQAIPFLFIREAFSFVPYSNRTVPWHVLVQKSSPSRDSPFPSGLPFLLGSLRVQFATLPIHQQRISRTPYVAYALILFYSLAIRMVGTSSLNRSDRLWTVNDAYTPPLHSPNILFPNLIMDLRDTHTARLQRNYWRIPPFQLHTDVS